MAQTTNLKPTYGNFKLYGEVQGLSRKYAFNDQNTQTGKQRQQLRFQVKTSTDNIVDVQLSGFKFDKVIIQPKDFEDNRRDELDYTDDVYDKIPEDWQIMMGVTAGLEQDEEGKNIRVTKTGYDMAKYIYENLKDGDIVFVQGLTNFNKYTNRNGEEYINDNLELQRIFKSNKELDFESEDFQEMSSFNQNIIIDNVDLDKKEKKAYVAANIIQNKRGDITPYTFWIDGNKYGGLVKNIRKLDYGTQIKVEGIIHSHPVYEEVEEEPDDWGDFASGFAPRQTIADVEKSFEITKGYPDTIEENKYTHEDLFPPQLEEDESDEFNPFVDNDSDNSDWGDGSVGSDDSPFNDENDPFADSDEF